MLMGPYMNMIMGIHRYHQATGSWKVDFVLHPYLSDQIHFLASTKCWEISKNKQTNKKKHSLRCQTMLFANVLAYEIHRRKIHDFCYRGGIVFLCLLCYEKLLKIERSKFCEWGWDFSVMYMVLFLSSLLASRKCWRYVSMWNVPSPFPGFQNFKGKWFYFFIFIFAQWYRPVA